MCKQIDILKMCMQFTLVTVKTDVINDIIKNINRNHLNATLNYTLSLFI